MLMDFERINYLLINGFLALSLFSCSPQTTSRSVVHQSPMAMFGIGGGVSVLPTEPAANSVVYLYLGEMSEADALKTSHCTGVLIGSDIVLTAGHCVRKVLKNTATENAQRVDELKYHFFASDYLQLDNLFQETEAAGRVVDVESFKLLSKQDAKLILKSEMASMQPADYDLALLRLREPFVAAKNPAVILSEQDFKNISSKKLSIQAVGYGAENAQDVSTVAEATLKTVSLPILKMDFSLGHFVVDNSQNGNICYRDSGGPGFVNVEGNIFLIGIAANITAKNSVSDSCKNIGHYTNVSPFAEWIENSIVELRSLR